MKLFYLFFEAILSSKSLLLFADLASEKSGLLDMVYKVIMRSKRLVSDIINRDYSALDHQIFGIVSVIDLCVIVVSIMAIRDIIIFTFKLSGSFFKNVVRVVMSYLSIQILVSTRHVALRCYATLLFCWELESVFTFRERIMQKVNQFLNQD